MPIFSMTLPLLGLVISCVAVIKGIPSSLNFETINFDASVIIP